MKADEAPRICGDIEISSKEGYALRTRRERIEDCSIDNAITIEESDSNDEAKIIEKIVPQATSPIPLIEPATPWRPSATGLCLARE